jgi:hypothetical protein
VIGSEVDLHIHVAQESSESVVLIEATPGFFQ